MVGITTNLKRKTKEDMFRYQWSEEYARRMYKHLVGIFIVNMFYYCIHVQNNCLYLVR